MFSVLPWLLKLNYQIFIASTLKYSWSFYIDVKTCNHAELTFYF